MITSEVPLTALALGETATVQRVAAYGDMRRRLLDLGLVNGTAVTCVFRSPAGDPTAYWIRGAVIALRARDAKEIYVRREDRT